jgi:hypothetical protein
MLKNKGELAGILISLVIVAAILIQIWTYVVGALALFGAYYALKHFNPPPPGPPRCRR